MGVAYIVRDATDPSNAHFAIYDSGAVRHVGGLEVMFILSLNPAPTIIAEEDRSGLVDLYRDSGTYLRPPWWDSVSPDPDYAPYSPRPA